MDAAEFASSIVVPTLKEALADRGDRRRQYLACIVVNHLVDYVARGRGVRLEVVREALRGICKPALDVVESVCNGTKHGGNERDASKGKPFFKPGMDRAVPVFAFDVPGAGYDQGRWEVPGLSVPMEGDELFLDACSQVVFLTIRRLYPSEIGQVDVDFIDAYLLPVAAPDERTT